MLKNSRQSIVIAAIAALTGLQSMPVAAQTPFVGQIMCAGFNYAPKDWARLDGQLLQINQNQVLFSLLGTTYGGNGVTNFALPDLRGRTLIHDGQGTGLSARQLGERGGAEAASLTAANLPPHSHQVAPLGSNNDATSVSPSGKVAATKARTTLYADPVSTVSMAPTTTSSVGGGVPVDKMPPFLAINCFIALFGIYPAPN